MLKYQNIIIGFGKGGKTLAKTLAQKGETVLVIEQSNQMYGGTCINIGCLPSKSLILSGEKSALYEKAREDKNNMTALLRDKNYHLLADEPTVTIWDGQARFKSDYQLEVQMTDGTVQMAEGERIFINTGATPIIPEIDGLALSDRILTSKEMMDLPHAPKRLVILGAGYIGVEFAAMFAHFGTDVTILDQGEQFLPKEDEDIAEVIAGGGVNKLESSLKNKLSLKKSWKQKMV